MVLLAVLEDRYRTNDSESRFFRISEIEIELTILNRDDPDITINRYQIYDSEPRDFSDCPEMEIDRLDDSESRFSRFP